MPNGCCFFHSGTALRGIAHPNYKHGRHSRYRARSLQSRLMMAEANPEPLRLLKEVHLIDVRLQQLSDRLDDQEHTSYELWVEAGQAFTEFNKARGRGHTEKMFEQLNRLEKALDAGQEDGRLWTEIFRCQERRRRMVESETKRLLANGQMMAIEELGVLINQVQDLIRTHVTDKDALKEIAYGLSEIMGNPATDQRAESIN